MSDGNDVGERIFNLVTLHTGVEENVMLLVYYVFIVAVYFELFLSSRPRPQTFIWDLFIYG